MNARGHLALSSLVVAGMILAVPHSAFAHARMVRSTPVKNARLSQTPKRIDLWFNELLDDGFNSIEVFAAAEVTAKQRTDLKQGSATVDPKDRTHLIVDVQPLPPGEYAVEFRVLSRDGHSAPGRFTFHVLGSN